MPTRVTLTVSDLDRAERFYTETLPFQTQDRYDLPTEVARPLFGLSDRNARAEVLVLQLGDEAIELQQFHGAAPATPIPADSRSNDLWFQHIAMVVTDMERAYAPLWEARVQHVSTAPQTLPDYLPNAAGIAAFYFRDPDGHNLELIQFPEGVGQDRWHADDAPLYAGIDHTAIGIARTARSLEFYEKLGFEIAGESENHGTEQEHLNQVFGARLLITNLADGDPVNLELLDYIAPPGGRPYPADAAPTDLIHWHTHVRTQHAAELFEQFPGKKISTEVVEWNGSDCFLGRDLDGHALLFSGM